MSMSMFQSLVELVARLKACPSVLGIARYGSRRAEDMSPGGDFDLFVLVKQCPEDVESLHFYVGDIPVDLNVRTLEHLRSPKPLTAFDFVLTDAEILYDDAGALSKELSALGKRWKQTPAEVTEHETQMNRFCQQHVLDKVRGRTEAEPLLCQLLLATNIYWLVQTYFRIRRIPYPGEKDALERLESTEPEIYKGVRRFYSSNDLNEKLEVSERLTDLVLASVGGPWRKGELVVFGIRADAEELHPKGCRLWRELFGVAFKDEAEETGGGSNQ